MTSPTSIALPPGPSAPAARSAGRPGTADRGAPEAFGSALEDALAGTGTATPGPATRAAGETSDDVAADAADGSTTDAQDADDAAAALPVAELPPGLWALLTGVLAPAATPVPATAAGDAPTGEAMAAAGVALTVPAAGVALTVPAAVGPVPGLVPGTASAPVAPAAGPDAAMATPTAVPTPGAPGQPSVDQARAAALAQAAGLTVVVAPADTDGPAAVAPPLPTVAGAADTVPVPGTPGLPAGGSAVGSDATATDGSGTGSGSGAPTSAAAESGPAPADDLTTGVPGTAPPTGAAPAPATGAAAPAAPAARETPVAAQLAPQLAVLRNAPEGSQTMTVVLTPDSLGEVTVQVTITDGTLDLMLRGASEHGRHALTDALPELRRELEGAGLSFSRLAVDPDAPRDGGAGGRTAEQQLFADLRGNGGQQQGSSPHRARAWTTTGTSSGEGPAPAAHPSASSGVDIRV
jgi:flagellar hook-length control protein FliK